VCDHLGVGVDPLGPRERREGNDRGAIVVVPGIQEKKIGDRVDAEMRETRGDCGTGASENCDRLLKFAEKQSPLLIPTPCAPL